MTITVNDLLEDSDKTVLKAQKTLYQLIDIQKTIGKKEKSNLKERFFFNETKNQDDIDGTLYFCKRNQYMEQSEQVMK